VEVGLEVGVAKDVAHEDHAEDDNGENSCDTVGGDSDVLLAQALDMRKMAAPLPRMPTS